MAAAFTLSILRQRLVQSAALTAALASLVVAGAGEVQAQSGEVPVGGLVAAGQATIDRSQSGVLTVTQASDRTVIDWSSYSVGSGGSVRYVQPGSRSAVLNRVTGNSVSVIAGSVSGNGQVYLVNANGIAITSSGQVDVGGGFVATTLDIADANFMQGRLSFAGTGTGEVRNSGTLSTGQGGFIALLANGGAVNEGLISAPAGTVAVGLGSAITLDPRGDGFLQIALPSTVSRSDPPVSLAGRIVAEGGRIAVHASTVATAIRELVNIPGELVVASAHADGGTIVLDSGAGSLSVSGRLDAGSQAGGGGGIALGGAAIALSGARIAADGVQGGAVNVGGGARVANVAGLTSADKVRVDRNTVIAASASSTSGGRVIVWSDGEMNFSGSIVAKGQDGDGGEVEISGLGDFVFDGKVNLLSANGRTGNLLLDPYDITISSAVSSGQSAFTANAGGAVINATTLANALATANITVRTGASGTQTGNITVSAPLVWTSDTVLTLDASGGVLVNAAISNRGAGGGVKLIAGGSGGVSGSTSGAILHNGTLTIAVNDHAATGTLAGALSGAGGLVKTGAGTLVLTRTNTATGSTHVAGGRLVIGDADSLGAMKTLVTVDGGAVLSIRPVTGVTTQQILTFLSVWCGDECAGSRARKGQRTGVNLCGPWGKSVSANR